MIVVVEGPDGAGKTTLAKRLCNATGLPYLHEGPPPNGRWFNESEALDYYSTRIVRAHREGGAVFDRFSMSEGFYGPALRNVDGLGQHGHRVVGNLLKTAGVITVLCLPPLEVCLDAWRARVAKGDELLKSEGAMSLCWRYYLGTSAQYDVILEERNDVSYTRLLEHLLRELV